MSLFGKKVFAVFNGLMVFAIISSLLFLPNEALSQSITWKQVYHDDYGRPLYTGGTSYSAPAFIDIDGDGDYDYFQGCRNGTIWFFENAGTPDSAAWHFVTDKYNNIYFSYFRYTTVSFADVDADGDFDMFVGGETSQDTSIYGIHFFRNDGDPYNPAWSLVTTKYHNINIAIDPGVGQYTYYSHTQFVDIDNDGDQDLFFISFAGRIAQYKNTGSDSLPNYILVNDDLLNGSLGGASRLLLDFCDIDDDGDFDLFLAEGFFRNIGTPDSAIWQFEGIYYNLDFARGFAFNDIDNDLDYDLFVGLRNGQVYQLENIGTPNSALWDLTNINPFSIDLGADSNPSLIDIDGDGLLELFVTHEREGIFGTPGQSIWFYENEGTPSEPKWTLITTIFDSIRHPDMSGLSFVDIDNDSDYDIFIGDIYDIPGSHIIFHENVGDSLSPQFLQDGQIILTLSGRVDLDPAFVDIDADGDYDMFISERNEIVRSILGPMHYYRNDGDIYQPLWTYVSSNTYYLGTVTFMDEDGDGDQDMFLGGWGYEDGNIIFYENIGDIYNFNFQFVTEHYDSIEIGQNYSPAFADIDSDGDLDLLIGEGDGGINLFRNDRVVGITPTTKISALEVFRLYQNYPNPFNPTTEIHYAIPTSQKVTIAVYNILGQNIKTLLSQRQTAGEHHIVWDGRDEDGQQVSSGIYFYQIQAGEFSEVKRALLLK